MREVIETRKAYAASVVVQEPESSADLDAAMQNRQLEIDRYWTRSNYFWTLTAAAIAGYFALKAAGSAADPDLTFGLACLGLVLSVGWYCVNRGSRCFQATWDLHVWMLEDARIGSLHKTLLDGAIFRWARLGPYPYSVTEINEKLNIIVCTGWMLAIAREVSDRFGLNEPFHAFNLWLTLGLTAAGVVFLLLKPGRNHPGVSFVRHSVTWSGGEASSSKKADEGAT